jgi:N,N'-diacetyllegionaminate synthase
MDFGSRSYCFTPEEGTIVIAEVGVNHNGDVKLAETLVDVAIEAGAHIVKFQAFNSEKEISKFAAKTPYQQETTSSDGNQLEMCKALELAPSELLHLKAYCEKRNMPFLCAAFDFGSVDALTDVLKVKSMKVASSEVTNLPMLEYIGKKKVGVILSTGASTLVEVGVAIDTLKAAGCPELILLHCVSSYPTPPEQANLRAMETLRRAYGVPVGFSDHTQGVDVAITAAALGAAAVEKHFTLDCNMEGPDHRASIEPHELKALVRGVRTANVSLGDGVKRPTPCEAPNLDLIRKSIVIVGDQKKGTRLTRQMLDMKRPAGGALPADLNKIIGRTLAVDVEDDAPVRWKDLV